MSQPIPYDEIDEPVRELVRALDEFDGIETIGSCGGHEDGERGAMHAAADEWWVTFELEPADPDADVAAPSEGAWLDLEFLVYWLHRLRVEREFDVEVIPYSPPPFMNDPGKMLSFELRGYRQEGRGEPDDVAAGIRKGLDELYTRGGGSES